VQLAQQDSKKYSLTPDMRLNIRMPSMTWPNIYDELLLLEKLCDPAALAPPPPPEATKAKSSFAPIRPGRR
jgi:hypothetical protein